MKKTLAAFVFSALFGLWIGLSSGPVFSAEEPLWNICLMPIHNVTVVAHRGAGDLAPENTMEALELTWKMGGIPEVDIRTTKDGQMVMFHDNDFRRILPNAPADLKKKGISDLTYDEVRKLDIGSFRGKQFAGQRVVDLNEICQALRKNKWRRVYIDVKNVDLKKLAEQTKDVHEQIVLATGSYKTAGQWEKVAPRAGALYWMGLGKLTDADIEKRFEEMRQTNFYGVSNLQIHVSFKKDGSIVPSEECLKKAGAELRTHGIEFQTMPWYPPKQEKKYYKRLLELGTAGFGSDRPDIAFESLREYYEENAKDNWTVKGHLPASQVIVQAHRGAGKMAPEGSLESFRLGWQLGCVPEADLRLTKDNVIVSFHDNDFRRIIPNVPENIRLKTIRDLTFAETQKLDIGAYCGEKFKGQKVIDLVHMLKALDEDPQRKIYVDIKQIDFNLLARQTEGYHPRLIVASSNYKELLAWKKAAPRSLTLQWLGGKDEVIAEKFAKLEKINFAGLDQVQIHVTIDRNGNFHPNADFLKSAGKKLRRCGILFQIGFWSKTDSAPIKRLLDLGCASFATGYPVQVRKAVDEYYQEKK